MGGITKGQLVFNTASLTDSDLVGSYTLDSSGSLIDGQTIAIKRWLNTASALFDGSGNALSSLSGSLNVNITGGLITTGTVDETAFVYGTDKEQPVGGVFQDTGAAITSGKTGAVRITANRAFHVNLRTSAGAEWVGQGTLATSFPVAIASDQSVIPVSDAALANTALTNAATAVTTTAAALIGSALANRKYLLVQNNGSQHIYLGGSTVTAANGLKLSPGAIAEFRAGAAIAMWAVAANGSQDTRLMELS